MYLEKSYVKKNLQGQSCQRSVHVTAANHPNLGCLVPFGYIIIDSERRAT